MDRIEAAAKAIAETFFKATAWEELFQSVRDGCIQAARDASAVLSDEPSYKKCGKVAQTFIAREGSFFPCALEEGHQGNCLQSGTCFRHGVYFGKNCPHWPTCAADARTPQEVLSGVGAALSQATPQQPLRCKSCGTTADKTKPYPACGVCGALLIEKPESTQEPPSQQEAEAGRLRGLCAAVYQFVGANMQKIGGCRRFLDALSNAANGEPFDTEHLLPYDSDEPICMTDVQPAPVQPSGTEDVVERTERETEIFAGPYQRGLIEGYRRSAKERAGWHSWESVEKAIRKVRLTGNEIGWNTEKFLKEFRAVLEAEPAARVTVKLVKTAIGHDMRNVFLDGQDQGVQFLEQHDAERYAAGLRAELDAQGGNGK